MSQVSTPVSQPWYRDRWPWLLISIPAVSAVLGIIMLVLALGSDDGLVVDDYYKEGLGINQMLDKQAHARELALSANVSVNAEHSALRVMLNSHPPAVGALTLRLVHPTRSGEDQLVQLRPLGGGMYGAAMLPPVAGRWHVILEDDAATWRLSGIWHTDQAALVLTPAQ